MSHGDVGVHISPICMNGKGSEMRSDSCAAWWGNVPDYWYYFYIKGLNIGDWVPDVLCVVTHNFILQ